MYSNIVIAVVTWSALARPLGADRVAANYQQPEGSAPNTYTATQFSSYGEDESFPFDLSLMVIPVLVVVGMALLFPTTTKVTARRRREVQGKTYTHITVTPDT
jgi:hypothetical protein